MRAADYGHLQIGRHLKIQFSNFQSHQIRFMSLFVCAWSRIRADCQMPPNASKRFQRSTSKCLQMPPKCHRGVHKQLTTGKAHDWQSLGLQSLELWRMRFPNWWKRWMDEVMTSWLIISDDSAFYLFFGLRKSSRITNRLCHCSSYWRLCIEKRNASARQVDGKAVIWPRWTRFSKVKLWSN